MLVHRQDPIRRQESRDLRRRDVLLGWAALSRRDTRVRVQEQIAQMIDFGEVRTAIAQGRLVFHNLRPVNP